MQYSYIQWTTPGAFWIHFGEAQKLLKSEVIIFAIIYPFLTGTLSLFAFTFFAIAVCRLGLHAGLSCTFSKLGSLQRFEISADVQSTYHPLCSGLLPKYFFCMSLRLQGASSSVSQETVGKCSIFNYNHIFTPSYSLSGRHYICRAAFKASTVVPKTN